MAVLVWAIAWAAMAALRERLDLAGLALVLVLAAAAAAPWVGVATGVAACVLGVAAFNWGFVPPRGTFAVDLSQHLHMLVTMAVVSASISVLVARQRAALQQAEARQREAAQLRSFGEALRDAPSPSGTVAQLERALAGADAEAHVLLERAVEATSPETEEPLPAPLRLDADERLGLAQCRLHGTAFGPGTGRHEPLTAWYLPLRGRLRSHGAALVRFHRDAHGAAHDRARLAQSQAMCDLLGQALERAQALELAAERAREAQAQSLRNTLLAAIAHDFRTPLATILGAASALRAQHERLTVEQRDRLAASIVEQTAQLRRMVDNTLQLARLDTPQVALALEWESIEEIVGSAMANLRARLGEAVRARVRSRVEPALPLLRCDAVLLVQMLDNLVDNALKHATASPAPVEIVARRIGDEVLLAVRDRGPGVPSQAVAGLFDAFTRGAASRGAGLGLALCRAVAQVHGARLTVRQRAHGGASFECRLPCVERPPASAEGEVA